MAWGWIESVGDAAGKVPDVAWGALVTGAFLLALQVLNNRREVQRRAEDITERQKERAHLAAQAAKEREHQRQMLVDAHNTELVRQREADERAQRSQLVRDKMDAYQAFLAAINSAERQIDNKTHFTSSLAGALLPQIQVLTLQEITDLQMLATRVIFLSPNAHDVPNYKSKIEASAESMLEEIQTIAAVYEHQSDPPKNSDFIRSMLGYLNKDREEYVSGVREELAELLGRDPRALGPRAQG